MGVPQRPGGVAVRTIVEGERTGPQEVAAKQVAGATAEQGVGPGGAEGEMPNDRWRQEDRITPANFLMEARIASRLGRQG